MNVGRAELSLSLTRFHESGRLYQRTSPTFYRNLFEFHKCCTITGVVHCQHRFLHNNMM